MLPLIRIESSLRLVCFSRSLFGRRLLSRREFDGFRIGCGFFDQFQPGDVDVGDPSGRLFLAVPGVAAGGVWPAEFVEPTGPIADVV